MSLLQSFLAHIGLLVGSLLISLALGELCLRLLGVSYPFLNHFTVPDPVLGYRLRPGAEGWQTHEGHAYVRINSAGLRDREHDQKKPPNTLRVAILGDSFAHAAQVSLEETFWSVAQQHLQSCQRLQSSQVEFINFGVSGYGTAQELLMLRERVWQYEPDWVVLAFFAGNDLGDNLFDDTRQATRPYFILQDGQLVLDTSFRENRYYRLQSSWWGHLLLRALTQSRLMQVLNQARLGWQQRQQQTEQEIPMELGLDQNLFEPSYEDWLITDMLITQMAQEVTAQGAEFLLMTVNMLEQVHPDDAYRQGQLAVGLSYPEKHLVELGQRQGFAVLSLAEPMLRHAKQTQTVLHGFPNLPNSGHWNADGHAIAGQLLAERICQQL